jgi:hypothetical protein
MPYSGFEEQPVPYSAPDPSSLVGELRSIGMDGPTYEVLRILDEKRALIRILESERDVSYPIVEILRDPGPDAAWQSR